LVRLADDGNGPQDPLGYDRLVRRFQSPAEREAEGRRKGFAGVLEADLWRAEARRDEALARGLASGHEAQPGGHGSDGREGGGETSGQAAHFSNGGEDALLGLQRYLHSLPFDDDEEGDEAAPEPQTKAEGLDAWRLMMAQRFVRGQDEDFDYATVDQAGELDEEARRDMEREEEERWIESDAEAWIRDRDGGELEGETGVQDF
jgi:hypothetical protein